MTLNEILAVIPKYRHHEIGYWNYRNSWVSLWCDSTDTANSQFFKFLREWGDSQVKLITATPKEYVDLQITIERPN